MTDRQKDMIDYYLPNDPDPTLEDGEYFFLQYTLGNPRVIRVMALDIFPCQDGIEYGIYQRQGGQMKRIDAGWGDPMRGVRMGDLYDNKQDCKDQTHGAMHEWEALRKLQREEAKAWN